MYIPIALSVAALISAVRASPNLYLVGDSTMAHHGIGEKIQGWGTKIGTYLQNMTVANMAVSKSSARSTIVSGTWYNVANRLRTGDYVVIEFGHNDGGDYSTSDRADVYGDDPSINKTVTLWNGTIEIVHTYAFYLGSMVDDCVARGATVIVSSPTPDNPYADSTNIVYSATRFVKYAKDVAVVKNVPYVDHFDAVMNLYKELGKATVDGYYPIDHTHTNDVGAEQVAQAFISALKCQSTKGVLAGYINLAGEDIGARCSF